MSRTKSYQAPEKRASREEIIAEIKRVVGVVPEGKYYFTLCDNETLPDSEYHQLIEAKVIQPHQYLGVNFDPAKIELNKSLAGVFITAYWNAALPLFNTYPPAVIYLDTTSHVKGTAIGMAVETLVRAPKKCLVVVNAMLNNPYKSRAKVDPGDEFISDVFRSLSSDQLKRWTGGRERVTIKSHSYENGSTTMRTYFLYDKS